MNNTYRSLITFVCLILFFFTINAQVDVALTLTADQPILQMGETTRMTLTLENQGTDAATAVVAINTLQEAMIADSNRTVSTGNFDGANWSNITVAGGESATLSFDITSQAPFLQLYAQVVFILDDLDDIDSNPDDLQSRCLGTSECREGEDSCIFEDFCMLEDDEAIYPIGTANLEITTVNCPLQFPQPNGELTYDLVIKNTGDTPSGIQSLGLFQTISDAASPEDNPPNLLDAVEVASINPGDSLILNHTFAYSRTQVYAPGFYFSFPFLVGRYQFSFDPTGRETARIVDLFCKKNTSDIQLDLTSEDEVVRANGILDYEVIVTNNGAETAYNLEVLYAEEDLQFPILGVVLDQETDFDGSYFSTVRLPGQPTGKYWHIPTLAVGDTAILAVSYGFNDATSLGINDVTAVASVSSQHLIDSNTANNRSILTVPRAGNDNIDLELSVSSDRPDIAQYESGMFTFTLENQGTVDATDVAVDVSLLDKVVQVGGSEAVVSSGSYFDGRWEGISIPAQGSVTLSVPLFSLVSELELFAQVTAAMEEDVDSAPANGICCTPQEDDEAVFRAATPFIDLELSIIADSSTLVILLNNNSPSFATGIQVELPLNGQAELLANSFPIGSNNSNFDPATGVWTIDTLPNYNIARLALQIVPLTDDFLPYAQVVAADQVDEDSTPNNGTCCTPQEDDEAILMDIAPRIFMNPPTQSKRSVLDVYPNPTSHYLNLVTNYINETTYTIYDAFGRKMQIGQVSGNVISVNTLPKGLYYLNIKNAEKPAIRFIKI